MTDKLRKCPDCGGEAKLFYHKGMYVARCTNAECGLNGMMHPDAKTAIAAWNVSSRLRKQKKKPNRTIRLGRAGRTG